MGKDAMSAHLYGPPLSLKDSFQKKSPKTLVSQHLPSLWHCMCHRVASLDHKAQGWWRANIIPPPRYFWGIFLFDRCTHDFCRTDILCCGVFVQCPIDIKFGELLYFNGWIWLQNCMLKFPLELWLLRLRLGALFDLSTSLSLTLLSTCSPILCLVFFSMSTLYDVLDDALSSLVASWHSSILTLTWLDGRYLSVAALFVST